MNAAIRGLVVLDQLKAEEILNTFQPETACIYDYTCLFIEGFKLLGQSKAHDEATTCGMLLGAMAATACSHGLYLDGNFHLGQSVDALDPILENEGSEDSRFIYISVADGSARL